jgi:uncharacterized protein
VTQRIEVVYALPERQHLASVELVDGMTAGDAVRVSRICELFPELTGATLTLGIYGEVVDAGRRLWPGDRVEIYRGLRVNPREARRRRVAGATTCERNPRRPA